jgi:aspartate/methionine/tyrosine aminotransferase
MRHSTRSEVDPFIVMDVMEAARAAEEAGRDIVHMEVGQPGSGAPQAARDRLAREMEGGPLGYTVALGAPICARRSRRFTANGTMWTSTRRAWC